MSTPVSGMFTTFYIAGTRTIACSAIILAEIFLINSNYNS